MNPESQASAGAAKPDAGVGGSTALPMATRQALAIGLLTAISALDGFDVLSVTFAAPGFFREFGIDKAALGWALSMGLIGMGLGSVLLAPLADLFGRRRLVLVNLVLMMLGMFGSAVAESFSQLMLARLVTGMGIGSMIAVITPLAVEYASPKRADLAVALMSVGYPIGGMLGGALSTWLLHDYGWRSVFVLGGVAASMLIPLVLLCMPESIAYLLDRRPGDAVARINRSLHWFGRPAIAALARQSERADKAPLAELLAAPLLWRTLQLIAINFLFVMAVYFFLNWLPSMVAEAGYSPPQATGVSVGASLTGIVGGVLLGWLAPRWGLRRITIAAIIGTAVGIACFGSAGASLTAMTLAAAITGFFLFSGFVGMLSIIASSFAPRMRATGAGLVIGIGRAGSALATVLAGVLFSAGLSSTSVSLLMAGCAVAAALALGRFQVQAPT